MPQIACYCSFSFWVWLAFVGGLEYAILGYVMSPLIMHMLGMSRARKRAIQVIVDVVVICVVFVVSMWLRLDHFDFMADPRVWHVLLPVVPFTIFVFVRLGFYRAVIRYIAMRALATIMLGSVLSGLALALAAQLGGFSIPRSVPMIYTILTFLCVGGSRFGFRELVASRQNRRKKRVAIYGAGASGRQLLQMLRQGTEYQPIAFMDDSLLGQGTLVGGLRVYGPDQLDMLVQSNGIEEVLLALPSVSKGRRSEILKSLEGYPLRLRTIPGMDDILAGKARIDDLNEIGIEDLLGRDPIAPRSDLLSANIRGKVVMVTGAGGSIGSELCRQILRQAPRHLVLFELSELALYSIEQELLTSVAALNLDVKISPVLGSVQVPRRIERTMRIFQVQTVYHAAAFKHVPLVEHNVVEGIRNNVFGTLTVAEAAIAAGAEAFILISTDKAVRPTNIMGASKRMAEMVCQSLALSPRNSGTKLSMVRFGNVLGSSGSVIPLFRRQIAAGGPITVTHPDITRFFMTIPEAAQLVIQAGAMAQGGDVFVLDMGQPVRIAELAAQMARLHGLRPVLFSSPDVVTTAPGEIGITFTQLRPGEKLYEELLIGNEPKATAHPRIMTATEICRTPEELAVALDQLAIACDRNDIERIRTLLIESQTGFQPHYEIVDYGWKQDVAATDLPSAGVHRLALVRK
jgi:FlaA1/EpsC-like NDP-sugar epimerase